jgi:hypothetical protein
MVATIFVRRMVATYSRRYGRLGGAWGPSPRGPADQAAKAGRRTVDGAASSSPQSNAGSACSVYWASIATPAPGPSVRPWRSSASVRLAACAARGSSVGYSARMRDSRAPPSVMTTTGPEASASPVQRPASSARSACVFVASTRPSMSV